MVTVLVGLVLVLVGIGAMVAVGPDDTITSGKHPMSTTMLAIATSPELLQYYGPKLHVTAQSTTAKPVFVGVAGQADADSYLADAPRDVIDQVKVPWSVHSRTVDKAGTARPVKPVGLDFWIVSATGKGKQSLTWPIANGPYSIVIMNADASPGVSARVSAGLEIAHAFATAAIVAVVGLLLIAGGWLLLRRRSPASQQEATQPESAA
ncbi:MAG: hypothetical protein DLM59_14895 [Pseudonocardiales bacterium]|nr:MAG: hypothetical protein DLM59_14895 [Pseudonocardiales bacterium]